MKKNNNNTPKLRFPGFTEAWEQRKLGEILSLLKDGTHGTHQDVENGPLLLSAKNIKNGEIYWDNNDRRISESEYKKIHSNFSLEKGDVLLTIVGSIGETAILKENSGITFQRSVAYLRPKPDIISEFLYTEIQSQKFQKELMDRKSTSAQPGIYLGDLSVVPVTYPKNIEEQNRIGNAFINLDNLITLHQRKLNHLQDEKKSLLQKMFPKSGEKFPELRFPGFTDDWEQRKLGDVCRINGRIGFRGYTQKDIISKEDGGVLTFSPMNIVDNRLTLHVKNTYITRAKYEESPEIMICDGDILFVKTGSTLGKSALVTGLEENASINPQVIVIRAEQEMKRLISVILTSETIQAQVASSRIGGAVPTLTETKIKEFEFYVPVNKAEKIQIGAFFKHLDDLITLHQRKLNHLQDMKKALLQQMFV